MPPPPLPAAALDQPISIIMFKTRKQTNKKVGMYPTRVALLLSRNTKVGSSDNSCWRGKEKQHRIARV